MKKSIFSRQSAILRLAACGGGIICLGFRYLLEATAIDAKGLMITAHPLWIGLWVLSAAMALILLAGARPIVGGKFPPSLTAALGCIPAMILTLQTATDRFQNEGIFPALLAAVTALAFTLMALCRLKGIPVPFAAPGVICLWLALEMLGIYQQWSFDPQLHDYCFQLFACMALTVAAYQFAAFGAGRGNHGKLWFWCLSAGFLCLMCLDSGLLFAAGAAWVLTNLSTIRLAKKAH